MSIIIQFMIIRFHNNVNACEFYDCVNEENIISVKAVVKILSCNCNRAYAASTEAPVICINPDIHKITTMILKIINTVTLFPRHRNWRHPVKYVITNDIRRTIRRERKTASRLRSSTISDREKSSYAVGAYNWVNDARMCIFDVGALH